MTGDDDDVVTVPDVTGLPFGVARAVASAAGVALANPDPDGPPIAAIAWQRDVRVGAQHPAGGAPVTRWASVAVELVEDDGTSEGAARVLTPGPPPAESAHGVVRDDVVLDLAETRDDER